MSEDQLPEFSGKLVLVYFKGSGASAAAVGHFIHSPTFKMQGGRLFLVGTLATVDGQGWNGAHTAIAWDSIEKYVVLDSMADHNARLSGPQKQQKRGWFS